MNLCQCGCGIKVAHKYVRGHHMRGRIVSEETKEKLRQSKLGEKNPNYGKRPSDESIRKQVESRRGYVISDETRKKISKSKMGHKVSKETKQKIGKKLKGRTFSDEYKKKMSKSTSAEKNGRWKGGCNWYQHTVVWKLHGKDKCDLCGMTNEEHQLKHQSNCRLSMHCRNKNYKDHDESNWVTVCEFGCHKKIENIDRI